MTKSNDSHPRKPALKQAKFLSGKSFPNINAAWGALIVEELVRNGIQQFCIAPGSRSTPLTVSIARHSRAKTCVHFDERSLAFFAQGYVTATHKPAVLVCTSGTAVANFLPAIIEASKKKIPLIVLTADRPPELRQTGAVQTIDQVGIFGKYVVWQTDLPCPDLNIKPQFVLTTIDQAVYQAVSRGGVVHINCMFRDPLSPDALPMAWGDYFKGLSAWEQSTLPLTQYAKPTQVMSSADVKHVAARINALEQGIIVVGKLNSDAQRDATIDLANRLGWPIFADIASGLRLGQRDSHVIHYFDQILLSARGQSLVCDGVIHLGGRITSKRYYEFIARQKHLKEYITVLNHPLRNDPLHAVTMRIETTVLDFCEQVGALIKVRPSGKILKALIKRNQACHKTVEKIVFKNETVTEPFVARFVSKSIPSQSGLFLSNSMPIRDMDMYADPNGAWVHVAGNRGASGIDGIIASAAGFAHGLNKPVTAMIGDLAALYDLNALAMVAQLKVPLIIVIVNNGGGAIFSFLPIAKHQDVFEPFFTTPHHYNFANAANMFGLNYSKIATVSQFANAYRKAFENNKSTIIEIVSDCQHNAVVHKALSKKISEIF